MPDSLLPIVIRVTRPFGTEDELLEHELETLTRTSITLLGAQPRAQGLVLRFELALSSGQIALRGEGRVVGYKPDARHGAGGLALRFTRLDGKSKALVDRAALLRERRRPSGIPSIFDAPSPSHAPDAAIGDLSLVPPAPESSVELIPSSDSPGARPTAGLSLIPFARRDRDALLERLRARSKAIDMAAVQRILESRRRESSSGR